MEQVIFSEKSHRYKDKSGDYISVTSLLSKFKTEFDEDFWSSYKAYEREMPNFKKLKQVYRYRQGKDTKSRDFLNFLSFYCKDRAQIKKAKKEILKEWKKEKDKSLFKGTRYHMARERGSVNREWEINPKTNKKTKVFKREKKKGADNYSLNADLFNLEDGYYPELLIWNEDFRIAGQADQVFLETDKEGYRYVDVGDFKTSKSIDFKSYKDPRTGYEMMKVPVDHLMDCNYNHYNLQLSMYGWMMERFGFIVRSLWLYHLNEMHEMKYLKKEIWDIVTHG